MICEKCLHKNICEKRACINCQLDYCDECGCHPYFENPDTEPCDDFLNEEELRQAEGKMTYSNIVSRPFVADKKSYPVRWVIVALCGISALILSILVVAAVEKIDIKE